MRSPTASLTSAILVVAFVLTGIGLAALLLVPTTFPQRFVAFVLGSGLAFAMVSAAGSLAKALRGPARRVTVTETVPAALEPLPPPDLSDLVTRTTTTTTDPVSA